MFCQLKLSCIFGMTDIKIYHFSMKLTSKQQNNISNGFLVPKNIEKELLYKSVVLTEAEIMTLCFSGGALGGHIGFWPKWPPGGYAILFAVFFENLLPIPDTIPNCRALSQSAQFLSNLTYSLPASTPIQPITTARHGTRLHGYVSGPWLCLAKRRKRSMTS